MKKCILCGELFEPRYNAQKYCKKDHFSRCPVCGKTIIWNNISPATPCSKECSSKQRQLTNLSRYGVINAGMIHDTRSPHSYDSFKYMQSIDANYANRWKQFGIDVWSIARSNYCYSPSISIDAKDLTLYVVPEKSKAKQLADQFLLDNGVQCHSEKWIKGVTLTLSTGSKIIEAIRLDVCKLQHFSAQLTNYGRNPDIYVKGGLHILIQEAVRVYEINSILAVIDSYTGIEDDMQEMGLLYQFSRPGLIYWDNSILYKRTHNINKMLSEKHKPITQPVRRVYLNVLNMIDK